MNETWNIQKWFNELYRKIMDCWEMLTFLKLQTTGSRHDEFVILRKDIERIERKLDALTGPYYGKMEDDTHDT